MNAFSETRAVSDAHFGRRFLEQASELWKRPGTPRAPERWPESSRTVEGSLELQNGGLRALEEAWDDFLLEAFSCQVWSFSVLGF